MSNRKGLTICALILVVGAVLCYLVYKMGSDYNNSQRERLLNEDFSEVYVEGVMVEKSYLDNLYLDKFIVRFEDDKVFLSYRG